MSYSNKIWSLLYLEHTIRYIFILYQHWAKKYNALYFDKEAELRPRNEKKIVTLAQYYQNRSINDKRYSVVSSRSSFNGRLEPLDTWGIEPGLKESEASGIGNTDSILFWRWDSTSPWKSYSRSLGSRSLLSDFGIFICLPCFEILFTRIIIQDDK